MMRETTAEITYTIYPARPIRFKAKKVWDREYNSYRLYIYCNFGTRKWHLSMNVGYNKGNIEKAMRILGVKRVR